MTRLVLVHGFTQTGTSWHRVVEAMRTVAPDLDVVTVDLPGHGTQHAVRADLWQSATSLGRTIGPAVYIGYSLGARVVLHLALSDPDVVQAMVLLGGTAGIDAPEARRARRLHDDELGRHLETVGVGPFLDGWLAQPLFRDLPPDRIDRAARMTNRAAGLAASLRLAGTGTQDPPLWARLSDVASPTLVLAGADDPKFCDLGQRLARGIGTAADFRTIPNAGHAAHLHHPDSFVEAVTEWLSATPVRQRTTVPR